MHANSLQSTPRRPHSAASHHDFATTSRVAPPHERRNRHAERWILVGWVLILAKCAILWWLIDTYQVPIHPLWLVGPTIMFGFLATAAYIWRD